MIFEHNFITNVRDPSLKTHQPSRRHALRSAAPPEAVKNDSGTVQTVNATARSRLIRLKWKRTTARWALKIGNSSG